MNERDRRPRDKRRKRMVVQTLPKSADFAGMAHWLQPLWVNGFILQADDEGRLKAEPKGLQSTAWPEHPDHGEDLRSVVVGGSELGKTRRPTVAEIAAASQYFHDRGMIQLYRANGILYAHISRWTRDQRIDHLAPSLLPEPPQVAANCPAPGDQSSPGGDQCAPNQDKISQDETRRDKENQDEPHAPPGRVLESESGGPEGPESDQARSGPFVDPIVLGKTLLLNETHYVQKAWALVLEEVKPWGPCLASTIRKLASRTALTPERALAWVLDIKGNPKVTSPWGSLSNDLKRTDWSPSDRKQEAAAKMIRGSPGPRYGLGTIGDTLKEMGGET